MKLVVKLVLTGLLLWFATALHAQTAEVVISDDGRQIKLNADGTWQQLSQDRFATNAAGQRIRLHPDGTWSPDGDAAAAPDDVSQAINADLAREPVLFLSDVTIVRRVIKRKKSKHAETRMQFMLEVDNRTSETLRIPADLAGRLVARSSRGATYEVLSVDTPEKSVAPGERMRIEVWTRDSPAWFGIKHLSLEVAPDTLGNGVARVLSRNMNEVKRVEVERFQDET